MSVTVFIIADVDSHDVFTGLTGRAWSDDLTLTRRFRTYEEAKSVAAQLTERRVTVLSASSWRPVIA